jgi:hypothetical protein
MGIRTTVTFDEDVLERVRQESRTSGKPFRHTLNDLLRQALTERPQRFDRSAYKLIASPVGLRPGLSYDNLEELLEFGEGPYHR